MKNNFNSMSFYSMIVGMILLAANFADASEQLRKNRVDYELNKHSLLLGAGVSAAVYLTTENSFVAHAASASTAIFICGLAVNRRFFEKNNIIAHQHARIIELQETNESFCKFYDTRY